jgi:hypothetical protein
MNGKEFNWAKWTNMFKLNKEYIKELVLSNNTLKFYGEYTDTNASPVVPRPPLPVPGPVVPRPPLPVPGPVVTRPPLPVPGPVVPRPPLPVPGPVVPRPPSPGVTFSDDDEIIEFDEEEPAAAIGRPPSPPPSGKSKWGCPHQVCIMMSGYEVKTVGVILRNDKGEILVATERDQLKFGNKYHIVAGSINSGSCPVNSCYEETAEESRLLPPINKDWTLWNTMFKPNGNYIIEPWYSSDGKAVVFVGNIGKYFWDHTGHLPEGTPRSFTNIDQLTTTFEKIRAVVTTQYKEKIDFKYVNPPLKGSNYKVWGLTLNMYGWATNLISQYVDKNPKIGIPVPATAVASLVHAIPVPATAVASGLPLRIAAETGKNAVIFPISKGGHSVFLTVLKNGQLNLFGGQFDQRNDNNSLKRTAQREAWEEGFRYTGGEYLDLDRIKHTETSWNGHTAYFIFKAPFETIYVKHYKNTETIGGIWLTYKDLVRESNKGMLKYPEPILFFADKFLKK